MRKGARSLCDAHAHHTGTADDVEEVGEQDEESSQEEDATFEAPAGAARKASRKFYFAPVFQVCILFGPFANLLHDL